ncbi:MAG: hypothetical protein HUJ92_06010 [Bacteroidales bacterium]|nr:hypothetical protein [Bacteroidales bacterium]
MAKKKSKKKKSVEPDFIRQEKLKLVRKYRKTILFNEKEMDAINRYCAKYGIKSKSAFIRKAVISHILIDMEENYPKLF